MAELISTNPAAEKAYKIIDLNLFGNSSDTFRTAVGGYWNTAPDPAGTIVTFQDYDENNILFKYFDKIEANDDLEITISEDVVVDNKKIPIRVYGNAEVLNDKHWRDLFLGGSFSGETILPIYNEQLFGYHYFESSLPYPKIEAAVIEGNFISNQIQISYDYNNYLSDYQSYINNLDSELLIPNYYILNDLYSITVEYSPYVIDWEAIFFSDYGPDHLPYDPDVIKSVTAEGNYFNIAGLFDFDLGPAERPPHVDITSERYKDQRVLATQYLSVAYIRNELSASTQKAIKNKFQNIILDDEALDRLYNRFPIAEASETFPYYVKIDFPLNKTVVDLGPGGQQENTEFVDIITKNKYTTRFLKTLKEVFNDEIADLKFEESQYAMNTRYLASSEGEDAVHNVVTTENVNLRTVDFIDMLSHNYNNYISQTDNCYFVGGNNIYREAMFDEFGAYRYVNTAGVVNVLRDITDVRENYMRVDSLENFLYQSEDWSYNETLAYRIQKVGGAPTGDGREQNTLQNYWLLNSSELEEFKFFDTQVKYGEDYTYHVYEYVLVVGARYKFSDLRLTQAIGVDNETDEGGTTYYGLEFYDPATGEKVEQLFGGEPTFESEYATLVQEKSEYPYLADFHLNYEPCLLIFEVPVFSKTLKVLDNPANRATIYPYQHMDASQRIGFGFKYDTYSKLTFPTTISDNDVKLKEDYLHGKDLLTNDLISEEFVTHAGPLTNYVQTLKSVSQPKFIEIYRISKRPTAYTDFDNKIIKILDLEMEEDLTTTTTAKDFPTQTYTVDFFDEKIRTNKKYYYLFRVLNEQSIIGHTSEIYETELVNDGGYMYAVFNVLHEEDLKEDIFVNPSIKAKKIIHLQPNIEQIALDTTDVDFEQEAYSQIDNLKIGIADELIWNKKFKLRLTSRKTGKKIDLNITYKLN